MVSRIILAGVIALFTLGPFAAPAAVSAKGGVGGHAGFALQSGVHPHAAFVQPHGALVAHPLARPHGTGFHRFWPPRDRILNAGWWWPGFDDIGPYGYYDPPYDQPGGPAASQGAASRIPTIADGATAPQPWPAVVYHPGCRTQVQTVPSELGGTRTVNITRCY